YDSRPWADRGVAGRTRGTGASEGGGIYADIELRAGEYGGMAAVPQSFDKRYFTLLLTAPHSRKLDHHLYIHLKYPRDVPKDFLKEFERLVDGFEKHVPATGKQARGEPSATAGRGRITAFCSIPSTQQPPAAELPRSPYPHDTGEGR